MSKKITELTAAESVELTDIVPIVDLTAPATTKKATVAQIVALAETGGATPGGSEGDAQFHGPDNTFVGRTIVGTGGITAGVVGDDFVIDGSGVTGTPGPEGPEGPEGPQGPQGDPGPGLVQVTITNSSTGSQTGITTTSGSDPATGILFTGAGLTDIHGLAGGTDGRVVHIVSANDARTLKHQSVTEGTAANRIICPFDTDYTVEDAEGVSLIWETTTDRWRVLAKSPPTGVGIGSANDVYTTNSGASAGQWRKLVNANVDAAAAIAGTKISPDFGSQTVQTTGGIQGGHFRRSGTVHTTAVYREPYNSGSSVVVLGAKDSGGTDRAFITYGAFDAWTLGNGNQALTLTTSSSGFTFVVGATTIAQATTTSFDFRVPVAGSSGGSLPFRLAVANVNDGSSTTTTVSTLSASEYSCPIIVNTGAYVTTKDLIFPNHNGAVWNVTTTNPRTLKVLGQTGVLLGAGKSRWVRCNGTDIVFMEVP